MFFSLGRGIWAVTAKQARSVAELAVSGLRGLVRKGIAVAIATVSSQYLVKRGLATCY
jgi:hypothetical protein